jgi:hypothetical protein
MKRLRAITDKQEGKEMTQCQRVLQFMDDYGSITTMQALEIGITRLASRIHDLRKSGVEIKSETIYGINRYGDMIHYSLYKRAV